MNGFEGLPATADATYRSPRVRKLQNGPDARTMGYGDSLSSRSTAYDQSFPPRCSLDPQLAFLEQRAEASDQALAESQHREEMLRDMLSEAKASIQSLGEEADHEVRQLQHEVDLKQVEYSEAMDELSNARRIATTMGELTSSTSDGLLQQLRLALSESQAECAVVKRQLEDRIAKESSQTEILCEAADREAVATNAIRESLRWRAERDLLREEVAQLHAETRALREKQEQDWRQHLGNQERLHADVAHLERLVVEAVPHERLLQHAGVTSSNLSNTADARKVQSNRSHAMTAVNVSKAGSHQPPAPLGEGPTQQLPDEIH